MATYQQWLRKYRLNIMPSNGKAGMTITELRVAFEVIKSLNETPNFSQIGIANPNQNLISFCQNGYTVVLEAGYENGNFGMIFSGEIVQTVTTRSNGTDRQLTLICKDGDSLLNKKFTIKTLSKGSSQRDVVDACCDRSQQETISSKVSTKQSIRGKVLFGSSSDYLATVAKSDQCQMYVENGKVNIISALDSKSSVYELTPDTGLVGDVTQTDDGISAECLLNPAIQLNAWVHIPSEYVTLKTASKEEDLKKLPKLAETGRYRVVKLSYKGDSMSGDWLCSFDAVTQASKDDLPGGINKSPGGSDDDDAGKRDKSFLKDMFH